MKRVIDVIEYGIWKVIQFAFGVAALAAGAVIVGFLSAAACRLVYIGWSHAWALGA